MLHMGLVVKEKKMLVGKTGFRRVKHVTVRKRRRKDEKKLIVNKREGNVIFIGKIVIYLICGNLNYLLFTGRITIVVVVVKRVDY